MLALGLRERLARRAELPLGLGRSRLHPPAPLGQVGKLRLDRLGAAAELVRPSCQLDGVLDPRRDLGVALLELPCVVEPRIHKEATTGFEPVYEALQASA